jgi:dipeptidyl aminopeptidase/acylaminoacyl peptidase
MSSPTFSRPATGPSRLAYQFNIQDVNIWRWDAQPDGAGTTIRLPGSSLFESHPAFSPDGRRIAYSSNRTGATEIWTANDDGSDPRQLTFYDGPVVILPQWSPDGNRVVFSSQVLGNRDIYVMRSDGSQPVRLTWELSHDDNPSWSRDGSSVYFRSDRSGQSQIWRLPSAGGGAPVRVTTGEASQGFESLDGRLLYFVRSMDVPGLWSVPVEGGREQFVVADVSEAFWGLADTGVAFVVGAGGLVPGEPTLRFFSFSTRTVSILAKLPARRGAVFPGFAVRRDGRSVLWTRLDTSQSDLMLIDPWR